MTWWVAAGILVVSAVAAPGMRQRVVERVPEIV